MTDREEVLKKILIAVILIEYVLLFLFLKETRVFADSFYPSADIQYCEFVPAVGLAISELPSSIIYDTSKVSGVSEEWVTSHTIHDVANIYAGSAHRYTDIASVVAVPPNSKVAVGFWWLNFSGHTINIDSADLFISDPSASAGMDLSRLLNINSNNSSALWTFYRSSYARLGKSIHYSSLGAFQNDVISKPQNGRILGTYSVKQPLEILSHNAECTFDTSGNLVMSKLITLKNVSPYELLAIGLSDTNITANVASQKEITLTTSENLGKVYDQNVAGKEVFIQDPNEPLECVTSGALKGDDLNPDSRVLIVNRDDFLHTTWFANQPDLAASPVKNFFCVRQLGYTLKESGFACHLDKKATIVMSTDKQSVQVGDSFALKIVLSNVAVSLKNEQLVLTLPAELKDYISGFTNATSISATDNGLKVAYSIPDLQSQQSITIEDTVHIQTPFPIDLLKNLPITATFINASSSTSVLIESPLDYSATHTLISGQQNPFAANLVVNQSQKIIVPKYVLQTHLQVASDSCAQSSATPEIELFKPQAADISFLFNGVVTPISTSLKLVLSNFNLGQLEITPTSGSLPQLVIPYKLYVNQTGTNTVTTSNQLCVYGTSLCNINLSQYSDTIAENCLQDNLIQKVNDSLQAILQLPVVVSQKISSGQYNNVQVADKVLSANFDSSVWNSKSVSYIVPATLAKTGNNFLYYFLAAFVTFSMSSAVLIFKLKRSVSPYLKSLLKNWLKRRL